MSLITRVQQRLLNKGFYHGPVDGDFGPLSLQAIADEAVSEGLPIPPWFSVALREYGTREVPGSGDNPRVLEYHAHTDLGAREDEVPWCSSFACFCVDKAGFKSTRSAAAISWMDWGRSLHDPQFGCVTVLHRTGGNHVAFFLDWDDERILLFGGNQSDKVCVRDFPVAMLRGFRWSPDVRVV